MKKGIALCISGLLVLNLSTMGSFAKGNDMKVILNDKPLELKDKAIRGKNQKILCPLDEIASKLGIKAEWNKNTNIVKLKKLQFKVGETKAKINGKTIDLPSKAVIINKKVYVAVDFISEVLGVSVDWDSFNGILRINPYAASRSLDKYRKTLTKSEVETVKKLNAYLEALEKYKSFHGTVLIGNKDKILLEKALGKANDEQNIKNDIHTEFSIGSVTKQFTAAAVLKLYEKGLLDLNDPLSKYIEDFPRGKDITLHHLLTHTSGITSFTELPEFSSMEKENINTENILKLFKDKSLKFNPGEKWEYSNSGYLLLGCIVEKVSDMPLADYLKKNIFDGAGMKNTGVSINQKDEDMVDSTGYTGYQKRQPVNDTSLLKGAFGAGYLYSTLEDLYLWDRALAQEKVLSKKTLDLMFTPYIDTKSPMGAYGYGFFVKEGGKEKEVFHGGNTFGYTAMISRNLTKGYTVVILTNNAYADVNTLKDNLYKILKGEKVEIPKEKKVVKVDPKSWNELVGSYNLDGIVVEIVKDGNHLYARIIGQQKLEIYSETQLKYFCKDADAEITFIKNDKGIVDELSLSQAGNALTGKKTGDVQKHDVIKVDPEIYDKYIGTYEVQGTTMEIIKENNHLYAKVAGQEKIEIVPESETKFYCELVGAAITFLIDDTGRASELVLVQGGATIGGKRIK